MGNDELLQIEPQELQFPFELRKQISCSMQLTNKSDNYVAFKVKTTNPKKYCVRPNTGVVMPHSTCDVLVTMQAQKEAPSDMQCKDKFLVQSVITSPGATAKDITPNMFYREEGHNVVESKLRVAYVAPPQPPSPVREGSEEGSSPSASVSDNGTISTSDFSMGAKTLAEPQALRSHVEPQGLRSNVELQDNSLEVKDLISMLTEEKNFAVQERNKLQQELDLLRHECKRSHGIPVMYVIIVGLLGLLLGYLLKKTKSVEV
ncbi:hypothetical protein ACH5RR_023846 [Cinchona calisaya]|uniref:MSP domain-containing protein n=1 Tax=Cinchona calisaya TaxID=153742 RepID=A0ABD2ZBT8_9GENT